MNRVCGQSIILVVLCAATSQVNRAQSAPAGIQPSRIDRVRSLVAQLHSNDQSSLKQYDATKDEVTKKLFSEIDGYIVDSFHPDSVVPDKVKAGLDAILGRPTSNEAHNIVFSSDLPAGRFLIVGIELIRSGGAINEDAVSFRAYTRSDKKLRLVASADDLSTLIKELDPDCWQPLTFAGLLRQLNVAEICCCAVVFCHSVCNEEGRRVSLRPGARSIQIRIPGVHAAS